MFKTVPFNLNIIKMIPCWYDYQQIPLTKLKDKQNWSSFLPIVKLLFCGNINVWIWKQIKGSKLLWYIKPNTNESWRGGGANMIILILIIINLLNYFWCSLYYLAESMKKAIVISVIFCIITAIFIDSLFVNLYIWLGICNLGL